MNHDVFFMRRDTPKLMQDIVDAAEFILTETCDRTFREYENSRMLRSAVERNFIIIGEAFARLVRANAAITKVIGDYPQIIGFRNIVVHGYDVVEDAIVWGIIQNEIPRLLAATRAALDSANE